CQKYSSYPRTF
nr:immunoglobulin light chain junction region [Macaca mulatta]